MLGVVALGCTGAQGPQGKPGVDGQPGMPGMDGKPGVGTPSVSSVTPPYAFLGRTVDLAIAGNGTSWSATTTVAFAEPEVKVNKVTAASPTGLLVNVTIGADATLAATDVTVTDGTTTEAYKGAFEIKAPLLVTVDPPAGVPQGGLANVHVQMLDVTTRFDAATAALQLSSPDLQTGPPQFTDFAVDFGVQADVLAQAGAVDVVLSSGPKGNTVDSPAKAAFSIVTRAPGTLKSTAASTGMIQTEIDTALFQFTPAAASQRFLQFSVSSMAGQVVGTAIPKSGKYADALSGFIVRFGIGTTSTDPFYLVVGDFVSLLTGAAMTPVDYSLVALEVPCTASTETAETATTNNDTSTMAQAVAMLPALVNGTLGYGTVPPAKDVDFYSFTVTGAPKKIHIATGGDRLSDAIVTVWDNATPPSVVGKPSTDDDAHQDVVVDAAMDGTYYVSVDGTSSFFDPMHNTYELFIEVK
jgi:hypothetical protein